MYVASRYLRLGWEVLILSCVLLFDQLKLVQKSFVADLQDFCCLSPIPPGLVQHPFDGFPLRLHSGAPADFQQRRRLDFRLARFSPSDGNGRSALLRLSHSGLIFIGLGLRRHSGYRAHDRLVSREFANNLRLVPDYDIALYQVLKLADVARPAVFHHAIHGVVGKPWRLLGVKFAVLAQEELKEDRYLLPTFTERRNMDRNYIQPVKK